MGTRGPIGKRPEDRLGHQTKEMINAGTKIQVDGPAPRERAPKVDSTWHPIAKEWFRSLSKSGQAVLYQPSDWATARYVADVMSRNLTSRQFSSVLFAAVLSGMGSLLATEGDRRRMKIELQRNVAVDADEDAANATVKALQERLAA